MKRIILLASLLTFAGALQSDATQLVRELWDNIPVGQLKGATNGTTSFGFYPSAGVKWVVNPSDTGGTTPGGATNVLQVISDDVQDWHLGLYDMLPPSVSNVGTLGLQSGNTNGWDSGSWAVRMLAPASAVNFSANGTYYFSARMIKRGLWWNSNGTNGYGYDDAALGFGLANGSTASSHFVGAGFTRTVAANGGGGYVFDGKDIGDSVYITTGTLGQAGLAGHPGDSGGPYYAQAYSTNKLQWVEGYIGGFPSLASTWVNGGFLVGKITTTTSGNSEVDVRIYVSADPIDQTDSTVSWDASYTFNEMANMNYLLVWMHGNNNGNPCYIDGLRVATTWAEAVGEEIVGPPSVSPTNTVYAGTPIVLSAAAAVNATSGEFQWMLYGTNIPGANDATYTNENPAVADSGPYSVTFENEFGAAASPSVTVTSQVQTVTVLPAVPPYVTMQPADVTRYANAPSATFSVTAEGAQPFAYQWKKVVGGTTNVLADETNQTLVLSPVHASDAGSYFLTISNWIGSTNSALAALNVIVPSPGGYAETVIADSPYAYWRMDETNGTVLHDYFAGYDGTVLDPANITLGVTGAAGVGFPAGHRAVFIPNNGSQARVNLPSLPGYSNTMTFACWLYTPSAPTANGLIFNRDQNNNGGYGNANGLIFTTYVPTPGVTNSNQLGYQWGTYQWTNSGLYVPQATWTFVALALDGTQATLYMGTHNGPLTVATATVPSALDAAYPGTTYSNSYPVMLGRTGWPWAETDPNNAWANANVSMSDLAIFYSALPAASINNLYLSALGEAITYTGSPGSLLLSWPQGTLQAASQVQGTYTNVVGATSPHPVSTTEARKFYRVQR